MRDHSVGGGVGLRDVLRRTVSYQGWYLLRFYKIVEPRRVYQDIRARPDRRQLRLQRE